MFQTKDYSESKFWIFRVWDFFWPQFVSIRGAVFEIRISDFFTGRWDGKFDKLDLFNNSLVGI